MKVYRIASLHLVLLGLDFQNNFLNFLALNSMTMKRICYPLLVVLFAITTTANAQIIEEKWSAFYVGQDSLRSSGVDIDASGDIVVSGVNTSLTTGDDIATVKYTPNGTQVWAVTYNGTGNGSDQGKGVTCDASGNYYVTGTSFGSANNDIVVIKYSASGNQVWVRRYDSGVIDDAMGIMKDGNGDLIVVGTSNNPSLGPDVLVLKYDQAGNLLWSGSYDSGSGDDVRGFDVAPTGEIAVVGTTGPGLGIQKDAMTVLFDPNGSVLWAQSYGGATYFDFAQDVVIDNSGNVISCGGTTDATGQDGLILRYDPGGTQTLDVTYDAFQLDDEVRALDVDASGNIFTSGTSSAGLTTAYMVSKCFNSFGDEKWSRLYYGEGEGFGNRVKDVVLAGTTYYVTGVTTNNGQADIVTIAYDIDGSELWNREFETPFGGRDEPNDIAVSGTAVYITGQVTTGAGTAFEMTTIKYDESESIIPADFNAERPSYAYSYFPNKGQVRDQNFNARYDIDYYTDGTYPDLYLKQDTSFIVFSRIDTTTQNDTLTRVSMTWTGAGANTSKPVSLENTGSVRNYYQPHVMDGREGIEGASRVVYPNIYDYVDLHFYSNVDGMKIYLVVDPRGDIGDVNLHFDDYTGLSHGTAGKIVIETINGRLELERPIPYQIDNNGAVVPLPWTSNYVINPSGDVSFTTGGYDNQKPLILQIQRSEGNRGGSVDFNWSTYLGNSGWDQTNGMDSDDLGNVYVAGQTSSSIFPTAGSNVAPYAGAMDAFVSSFAPGGEMLWSTYYGGLNQTSGGTNGNDIAQDVSTGLGDVFIVGLTTSNDLVMPPPAGAYQDNVNNGTDTKGFIAKFNTINGALQWASYFGDDLGTGSDDRIRSVSVDPSGNIFIGGYTALPVVNDFDFVPPPGTGHYETDVTKGRIFIAKFTPDLTLVWSTLYGTGGDDDLNALETDLNGNLIITGNINNQSPGSFTLVDPGSAYQAGFSGGATDGFISKFNTDLEVYWATYLGGTVDEEFLDVETDASGNIYVVGNSTSPDFPVFQGSATEWDDILDGGFDGVIGQFDPDGIRLWTTYWGGSSLDAIESVSVGPNNELFISGYTISSDFPTFLPSNYFTQASLIGTQDMFITGFDDTQSFIWSTYVGGNGGSDNEKAFAIEISSLNKMYVSGQTESTSPSDIPLFDPGIPSYYQGTNFGVMEAFMAEVDVVPPIITGIQETGKTKIHVYPNPFTTDFTIVSEEDIVRVQAYDITGKKILDVQPMSGNRCLINNDEFPTGVLYLTVTTTSGRQNVPIVRIR